jgi:hypothetical protein
VGERELPELGREHRRIVVERFSVTGEQVGEQPDHDQARHPGLGQTTEQGIGGLHVELAVEGAEPLQRLGAGGR